MEESASTSFATPFNSMERAPRIDGAGCDSSFFKLNHSQSLPQQQRQQKRRPEQKSTNCTILFQLLLGIIALSSFGHCQPPGSGQELALNHVVGEPFISCAGDSIYVKLKTSQTFKGHVNVRYAPNKFCFQVLVTNNQIELLIPHLECQVNRIRSLHPAGFILETSVLISFHPEFVTADDRIYTLKCFHNKPADMTGSIILLKGVPLTEREANSSSSTDAIRNSSGELEDYAETSKNYDNFTCSYRIKDSDGLEPDSVEVGQEVVHQWRCTNTSPDQCLVVNNCILRTYNSQHELIDNNGCSKDLRVMPQLEYLDATLVEAKVKVFGVAQRPFIHFQCQLTLLTNRDAFCQRPICGFDPLGELQKKKRAVPHTTPGSQTPESFDVLSQELEVVQPGKLKRKIDECKVVSDPQNLAEYVRHNGTICVSKTSFVIITVATIIVAISTLIVVLYIMWRRFRYMDVPSSES